ncbi:ATP-dependent Clp protease adapter ClpS [Kocuria coralli]|uniref:ATP-dependent Clp protease adapter ClpS n=1 Tax=Kocuria coralli TaxID=1461025 RepID=UPI003CCC9C0E
MLVSAVADPAVDEQTATEAQERTAADVPWQVVVWDDPVNLMSWVTWVFRTYFGYPQLKAHALMMEVHTAGRAVVASGTLEQAEKHVAALHGYGLWATYERATGPGGSGANDDGHGGRF